MWGFVTIVEMLSENTALVHVMPRLTLFVMVIDPAVPDNAPPLTLEWCMN